MFSPPAFEHANAFRCFPVFEGVKHPTQFSSVQRVVSCDQIGRCGLYDTLRSRQERRDKQEEGDWSKYIQHIVNLVGEHGRCFTVCAMHSLGRPFGNWSSGGGDASGWTYSRRGQVIKPRKLKLIR